MGPPPPRTIEEVTEADGLIKIKISFVKNKQLKCWWSDTDRVNPLGMAEPGGNKPFVWRGAGVWARFWEACSHSTRPFTRTPEQVADAERRSKQPRKGETYEVEKVLAFDPEASDNALFLVKWFGYDNPSDNTQEPATSFGAGLDTYTWGSQEAWQHFCREGPSTFNPIYAPGPAPVSKSKKAAESKEHKAGKAEGVDSHDAAAAGAAAAAPAAAPPTKRSSARQKAPPAATALNTAGPAGIPSSAKPPLSSLMRSGRSKAKASGGAAAGGGTNKAAGAAAGSPSAHADGGRDRNGAAENGEWPGGAMEIDGGEEEEEEADGEATAGSVCAALRNVFGGGGKSGKGSGKRSAAEARLDGGKLKEGDELGEGKRARLTEESRQQQNGGEVSDEEIRAEQQKGGEGQGDVQGQIEQTNGQQNKEGGSQQQKAKDKEQKGRELGQESRQQQREEDLQGRGDEEQQEREQNQGQQLPEQQQEQNGGHHRQQHQQQEQDRSQQQQQQQQQQDHSQEEAGQQQKHGNDDAGFHSACSKGHSADGERRARDEEPEVGEGAAAPGPQGADVEDPSYNPLARALAAAEAQEAAAAAPAHPHTKAGQYTMDAAAADHPGAQHTPCAAHCTGATGATAASQHQEQVGSQSKEQQEVEVGQQHQQQQQQQQQQEQQPHEATPAQQLQQQQQPHQNAENGMGHVTAQPHKEQQPQQHKGPCTAPEKTPASHLVAEGVRVHQTHHPHLPHHPHLGPMEPLHMGGFTLMRRPGSRGRTQRTEEHAIMVTTSDKRQFMVDASTGLANVPDKYRREVSAQLEVMHGLAAAVLHIR